MAGNDSKITLNVGVNISKSAVSSALKEAAKDVKITAKLSKVTVSSRDLSGLKTKIQQEINKKDFSIKSLRVKKIDCKSAIADMKAQLQSMIDNLSIKNNVKITGLGNLSTSTKALDKTAELQASAKAAEEAAAKAVEWNAKLKVVETTMKQLTSAYNSMLTTSEKSPNGDAAKVQELQSAYLELIEAYGRYKEQKSGDTAELEALTARVIKLREESSEYRNLVVAKDEAAAAAERQAEKDKKAADAALKSAEKRTAAEERRIQKQAEADAKRADSQAKAAAKEEQETLKQINLENRILSLRKEIVEFQSKNMRFSSTSEYSSLNGIVGELDQMISGTKKLDEVSLAQLRGEFIKTKTSMIEMRNNASSIGAVMRSLLQSFTAYISPYMIFMKLVRGVKQVTEHVKDLDSAMVELRRVTDETEATYSKFFDGVSDRAKKLGTTMSDTINATADFARLGYSLSDATKLADVALVYNNVGDEVDSINEATQSIISSMQAFGISADGAIDIVDKFNHIGNNFAITSGGVGEALQKSASALNAAGNDINESIALITAANTIVQNPASVGTSMKTLSMYLRASKTEAEEAGESTEGMADSVSKLREEILSLTGRKVDIQIDENTYKNTYQVLKELSEVWDELEDITRANILERIGGKRNANVTSALIENFEVAEKALEATQNAMGSATKENEKYLDSVEGRQKKLSASIESLSSTLMDSGFLKGIISIGTAFVSAFESITKLTGAIPPLSAGLTGIISLFALIKTGSAIGPLGKVAQTFTVAGQQIQGFSQMFGTARKAGYGLVNSFGLALDPKNFGNLAQNLTFDHLTESLENYSTKQANLFSQWRSGQITLENYNSETRALYNNLAYGSGLTEQQQGVLSSYLGTLNGGKASVDGFKKACLQQGVAVDNLSGNLEVATLKTKALAIGQQLLNTAFSMLISMGIALAIQGIIKLISNAIHHYDNLRKKIDEIRTAHNEEKQEVEELNSKYADTKLRINELRELLDSGTITLVEREELTNLEYENELLEQQVRLLEQRSELSAEEANNELIELYNSGLKGADKKSFNYKDDLKKIARARQAAFELENADALRLYYDIQNDTMSLGKSAYGGKSGKDASEAYSKWLELGNITDVSVSSYSEYVHDLITQYNQETNSEIRNAYRNALLNVSGTLYDQYLDPEKGFVGDNEIKQQIRADIDLIDSTINRAQFWTDKLEGMPETLQNILKTEGSKGTLTSNRILELASTFKELNRVLDAGFTADEIAANYNALGRGIFAFDERAQELEDIRNTLLDASYNYISKGSVAAYDPAFIEPLTGDIDLFIEKLSAANDAEYNFFTDLIKNGTTSIDKLGEAWESVDLIKSFNKGLSSATNGVIKMDSKTAEKAANEYNRLVGYGVYGNVDYSRRPVLTAGEVRSVYPEFTGNYATTYDQGFYLTDSNGRNHAIVITPILENGEILSQQSLNSYVDSLNPNDILGTDTKKLIIHTEVEGGSGFWKNGEFDFEAFNDSLIPSKEAHVSAYRNLKDELWDLFREGAKAAEMTMEDFYNTYNVVGKQYADSIKSSISELWSSDDFKNQRAEIEAMAQTSDGITAKGLTDLAAKNVDLNKILHTTGMSAEWLAKILTDIGRGTNGTDNITASMLELNEALIGAASNFDNVTAALARYNDATSVNDYDTEYKSYAAAFKEFSEEVEAGTTNSIDFWADAELLLGADALTALGYDTDKVIENVNKLSSIFTYAEDSGASFAEQLYEDREELKALGIMSAELDDDGNLSFENFDFSKVSALAEYYGTTEEAVYALFKALQNIGYINFSYMDDVVEGLGKVGAVFRGADGELAIDKNVLNDIFSGLGLYGKATNDVILGLEESGYRILDLNNDIESGVEILKEFGVISSDPITPEVDVSSLYDFIEANRLSKEKAEELIDFIEKSNPTAVFRLDDEAISINDTKGGLEDLTIYKSETEEATEKTEDLSGTLDDAVNSAEKLNNTSLSRFANNISDVATRTRNLVNNLDKAVTLTKTLGMSDTSGATGGAYKELTRSGVGGYAQAAGTAGASHTERALTGELGPELRVRPGTNSWELLGEHGAEFADIRRGDIIFNAAQTKQLLSGGRISSRGKALVNGTAYANTGTISLANIKKIKEALTEAADSSKSSSSSSSSSSGSLSSSEDAIKTSLESLLTDLEHDIFMEERHEKNAEKIIEIYKRMQEAVHASANEYRAQGKAEDDDAIQELQEKWWGYQDSIRETMVANYDRITSETEFMIDEVSHAYEEVLSDSSKNNDIAAAEEYVYKVSSLYSKLRENINDEIEYYRSLGFKETSDEISALKKKIWDIEKDAEEAAKAVMEAFDDLNDSINEIIDNTQSMHKTLKSAASEYSEYGYLTVDTLQDIIKFGVQYLSYLEDENGQLVINEKVIKDIIAAQTERLAIESSMAYIEKLRNALANDDVITLNDLLYATKETANATWDLVYANLGLLDLNGDQFSAAISNINRLRALSANVIENIDNSFSSDSSSRSESYKEVSDSLDYILKLTMDLIKYETDQQKDALKDQIDSYKDIIDLKKKSLDLDKSSEDYSKSVSKKLKEIASLQSRINQLSLDDSREALAERLKLEEELAEKQEDLYSTQRDHGVETNKDVLDKELKDFEDEKNEEIKVLEDSISSQEKLYRLAIERIDAGIDSLFNDVIKWNYEAGNTLEKEIIEKWHKASEAVKEYGSYISAVNSATASGNGGSVIVGNSFNDGGASNELTASVNKLAANMKANSLAWYSSTDAGEQGNLHTQNLGYKAQLESILGTTLSYRNGTYYRDDTNSALYTISDDEVARAVISKMKENSAAWKEASGSERSRLDAANIALAARLQEKLGKKITRDSAGVWWIGNERLYDKYPMYHTGGIVGDRASGRQNEVLALLEKGEAVLDKQKEKGLYQIVDFTSFLSEKLGKALNKDAMKQLFSNGGLLSTIGSVKHNGLVGLSEKAFAGAGCVIEQLNVTAPISVMQKLDENEIREHSRMIGEISAQYIEDGFKRRGIKTPAKLF